MANKLIPITSIRADLDDEPFMTQEREKEKEPTPKVAPSKKKKKRQFKIKVAVENSPKLP